MVIIGSIPRNFCSPQLLRIRMRCKSFVLRKISCHLYGANSQYFKNAHTSGTPRQKTIISAASTWVPEMLSSVVASRRANKRLTPAGLKEKCRPALSLIGPVYVVNLVCQEGAAQLRHKLLNRWSLERSQIAFSGQRVRGSNQMSKIRQYNTTSNQGPHTDMEVSEPGPPAQACPMLWRIPKRITRYLDNARSTRATTFARERPVFHGVRQGQAQFCRTA